jgi:hypothetical protein
LSATEPKVDMVIASLLLMPQIGWLMISSIA